MKCNLELNNRKAGKAILGRMIPRGLLGACLFALFPFTALAQQGVDLEAIRKDLQAAKASSGSSGSIVSQTGDAFSMKPEDLEKRRAELLAQENALLNELQNPGHAPEKAPEAAVPVKVEATINASDNASEAISNDAIAPAVTNEEVTAFRAPAVPSKISPTKLALPDPVDESPRSAGGQVKLAISDEETEAPQPARVKRAKPQAPKSRHMVENDEVVPAASHEEGFDVERIKSATSALESNLSELRKSNLALQAQLKSMRAHTAEVEKELEETRDRLMFSDAEVERLSGIVKARNQQSLSQMGAVVPSVQRAPVVANPPAPVRVKRSEPAVTEDVLIGTVVADKANLRTGPGKDNSPIMNVSKGTRLTVETRTGDWYRVITPTGTRAWVAAEVLAFGETGASSPTRTVRIKGYDASIEDPSLKLISSQSR